MQLLDRQIDESKLMTMAEVLASNSRDVLSMVRDRYYDDFGRELLWHYPISDGDFLGCYIAPVREGFLCLPYNCVDREDCELIDLDQAKLLEEDDLCFLRDDWESFAGSLQSVLGQMIQIVRHST